MACLAIDSRSDPTWQHARRTKPPQLWLQLGLIACMLCTPAVSLAAEMLIRMSHVVAPNTPKGQMAVRFQQLVSQASAGRIRVEVYPNSTLYGDADEIDALQLGAVELLAPALSKLGPVGDSEFELFDLPFLFNTLTEVRCVTQGPIGAKLLQGLSRQQMVGLGFLDNGFKQMSAPHVLRQIGDYKGLRLRIQASRVLSDQMRALGAQPVVLPFGDTHRALAQGLIDGAENPLSNFMTQGLASVQRALTLTDHGYLGYAIVANQRFWDRLNDQDRRLIRDAMKQALLEANARAVALNSKARLMLKETKGLTVHRLTPSERSALRAALLPVQGDFARRAGGHLLQDVKDQCLDRH